MTYLQVFIAAKILIQFRLLFIWLNICVRHRYLYQLVDFVLNLFAINLNRLRVENDYFRATAKLESTFDCKQIEWQIKTPKTTCWPIRLVWCSPLFSPDVTLSAVIRLGDTKCLISYRLDEHDISFVYMDFQSNTKAVEPWAEKSQRISLKFSFLEINEILPNCFAMISFSLYRLFISR